MTTGLGVANGVGVLQGVGLATAESAPAGAGATWAGALSASEALLTTPKVRG